MFLVVNPDGDTKNYRTLSDDEIGQFVANSYTVLQVTTPIATAELKAFTLNEDATREKLEEQP